MKGLEFLSFADIEALSHIDKGGKGRIQGTESAANNGANVGCGNRLRRCITRVPLVLMASVQDKPEITGGVGTNQCRTIHNAGDVFQTGGDLNVIDSSIDRRKGAENLVWRKPARTGGPRLG